MLIKFGTDYGLSGNVENMRILNEMKWNKMQESQKTEK